MTLKINFALDVARRHWEQAHRAPRSQEGMDGRRAAQGTLLLYFCSKCLKPQARLR